MKTIVADFETTTPSICADRVWVYLANWMYLDDQKEKDHITFTLHDFMEDIAKIEDSEIKCYFHNGGCFDIQFILNYVIKNLGYNQVEKKKNVNLPNTFYILEDSTRIYELCFFYNKKLFTFRDSLLLLGSGIKALGKVVGMEKLNFDYDLAYNPDNIYSKEELEYVHNDVAILRRGLASHLKYWGDLDSLSIAGQCFKSFAMINKMNDLWLSIKDYEYFKHWYFGGMCTYKTQLANKWIKSKIYVYDINSSYPSSQVNPQPVGKPLKYPPKKGLYTTFMKLYVYHAKIRNRNWAPVLRKQIGVRSDNPTDYIYEGRDFILYVIEDELEWYKKFYQLDYEILEKWYFECKPIFKQKILDLYDMKVKAKQSGDKVKEFLTKRAVNSMYGKYAQKPYFPQVCYWTQEEYEKALKNKKIVIHGKRTEASSVGSKTAYIVYPASKKSDKANYIPTACDITSIARCKLLKAIWENRDSFLYCDTDSVFLTKPAKGLKISDYGLGEWKLEKEADGINFLQCKFYRMIDKKGNIVKQAHAGVKEEAILKIPNKDYKLGLEIPMGKLMKVKVDGGIYLIDKKVVIGENKKDLRVSCSGNSSDPTQPLNYETAPNEVNVE